MVSLETLNPGGRGEIMQIGHCGACGGKCNDHGHVSNRAGRGAGSTRAEEMGLRTGKRVEMLEKDGNHLLLQVDDEQIAIDRRMATKIMVREDMGPLPELPCVPAYS